MKDLSSHMMDIVQNSIRAEASWIQIRICEDPEADLFLIEIQDNGCGMDEATLARVRDPFFKAMYCLFCLCSLRLLSVMAGDFSVFILFIFFTFIFCFSDFFFISGTPIVGLI